MRIVVAGGTGFIGKHLVQSLQKDGHEVTVVSRQAKTGPVKTISWDQIKKDGLPEKTEAVIQLAGASILQLPRWTDSYKQEIIRSRVDTGMMLVEAIKKTTPFPRVYIAASAVGIYPIGTMEKKCFEDSQLGNDFPAQVCREVERVADAAGEYVERVVKMRTGIVLSKKGGALQRMWMPFKFGLGGTIGFQGQQPFPWIHLSDMVGLYRHALTNPNVNGAMNATSPNVSSNYEFTKALGNALWRPTLIPVPDLVLRTVMGEESVLLLDGQHVYPEKALKTGYKFQFPDIEQALNDIRDSVIY